jgi:hypothetical protein
VRKEREEDVFKRPFPHQMVQKQKVIKQSKKKLLLCIQQLAIREGATII